MARDASEVLEWVERAPASRPVGEDGLSPQDRMLAVLDTLDLLNSQVLLENPILTLALRTECSPSWTPWTSSTVRCCLACCCAVFDTLSLTLGPCFWPLFKAGLTLEASGLNFEQG